MQEKPKKKPKVSKPKVSKPKVSKPVVAKPKVVSDTELKAKIEDICNASSMEDLTMRVVKEKLADAFGASLDIAARKAYIKDTVNTVITALAGSEENAEQ